MLKKMKGITIFFLITCLFFITSCSSYSDNNKAAAVAQGFEIVKNEIPSTGAPDETTVSLIADGSIPTELIEMLENHFAALSSGDRDAYESTLYDNSYYNIGTIPVRSFENKPIIMSKVEPYEFFSFYERRENKQIFTKGLLTVDLIVDDEPEKLIVNILSKENKKWYVDKFIAPENMASYEKLSQVFISICINGKFGIADGHGEIAIEPDYAFTAVLPNGMYLLSDDIEHLNTGKLYYPNGNLVFPGYESITVFGGGPDGNTAYTETRVFLYQENGIKGMILEDGTKLTEAKFDDVRGDYRPSHSTYFTRLGDKYGIATLNGEIVEPIYDDVPQVLGITDGVAFPRVTHGMVDGEWKYYKNNEYLPSFSEAWSLEHLRDCFILITPNGIQTLDEDFNILHTFEEYTVYDNIGNGGAYSLYGLLLFDNTLYDKYGNIIVPYFEGSHSLEHLIEVLEDIKDTHGPALDFYNENLNGILQEIETEKYVYREHVSDYENLFSLRLSAYSYLSTTYFPFFTDGTHSDDIDSRISKLMSAAIKNGRYESD